METQTNELALAELRSNSGLEIYQQRYETFRHLDNLRWLMFQIGIGAASLAVGVSQQPKWHTWVAVGFVLLATGIAMGRVNSGIAKNGEVLKKVGETIGDSDIPPSVPRFKSLSSWMACLLSIIGLAALGYAGYSTFGD